MKSKQKPKDRKKVVASDIIEGFFKKAYKKSGYTEKNMGMSHEAKLYIDAILKYLDL